MKTKITTDGVRVVIDDRAMAEKLFESNIVRLYSVDKLGVEYEIQEYSELLEFIMDDDYCVVAPIIRGRIPSEDNKLIGECVANMLQEDTTARKSICDMAEMKRSVQGRTATLVRRLEKLSRECLSAVRQVASAEGCEPFTACSSDRPERLSAMIRREEHLISVFMSGNRPGTIVLIVSGPPNLMVKYWIPEDDWEEADTALNKFLIRLYTYYKENSFRKALDGLNEDLGVHKK